MGLAQLQVARELTRYRQAAGEIARPADAGAARLHAGQIEDRVPRAAGHHRVEQPLRHRDEAAALDRALHRTQLVVGLCRRCAHHGHRGRALVRDVEPLDDAPGAYRFDLPAFERDPGLEVVGEAEDGASAVSAAERLDPDFVLAMVTSPLKTRLLGAGLFLMQRGVQSGITIYAPAIILSTVLGWRLDLTNYAEVQANAELIYQYIQYPSTDPPKRCTGVLGLRAPRA